MDWSTSASVCEGPASLPSWESTRRKSQAIPAKTSSPSAGPMPLAYSAQAAKWKFFPSRRAAIRILWLSEALKKRRPFDAVGWPAIERKEKEGYRQKNSVFNSNLYVSIYSVRVLDIEPNTYYTVPIQYWPSRGHREL